MLARAVSRRQASWEDPDSAKAEHRHLGSFTSDLTWLTKESGEVSEVSLGTDARRSEARQGV